MVWRGASDVLRVADRKGDIDLTLSLRPLIELLVEVLLPDTTGADRAYRIDSASTS